MLIGLVAFLVLGAGCVSGEGSENAADSDPGAQIGASPTVVGGGADTLPDDAVALPEITAGPGVLVWAHDREPPDLHAQDPDNGTDIAWWIRQGLLEGLYGIDSNLTYVPELLAGDPVVEVRNSGTVGISYELRSDLRWSDGTPLTANDVAYTHQIIVEGCEDESDLSIVDASADGCILRLANRNGYDLVTGLSVADDTHFTVELASFFPGWRGMYDQIFAAHAFGENADAVNENLSGWQSPEGMLPSSGPLTFAGWEPGVRIDLGANDQYHGSINPEAVNTTGPPSVAGVQIAFVSDLQARMELMRSGQAHVLMSQLDPDLVSLTSSETVTVDSRPGDVYDHLGLNLLDSHLAKPEVREAIAYAVDKGAIVSQVYEPLVGTVLPEQGLGNSYWLPGQPGYVDHQEGYAGHQVDKAKAKLEEAGYEAGSGGVYSHPDDGRLTVRAATTGGNRLREQELDLVAAQLGEVGIEVRIENVPGGLFFEEGPFSTEALAAAWSGGREGDGDLWDLALFSWASGPWPGAVSGIYRSESRSNPYGFSNPQFNVAASECDAKSDDGERVACYNDLDTFATTLDHEQTGLFVIPLTQKTHYFAYGSALASAGVAPDSPQGGPLVNIGDFQLDQ